MGNTEYFSFDTIKFYIKRKFDVDITNSFFLDLVINKEVRYKIINNETILVHYNDLYDNFDKLYTIYKDIRSNRIKKAYKEMWNKDMNEFDLDSDEIPTEYEYRVKYAEYISKLKD